MERELLGDLIKDILGNIASNSEGKEKLHAGVILMDFELINTIRSTTERLTSMVPNALTEEQYEVIKDAYQSIKAEYSKILNILSGETRR